MGMFDHVKCELPLPDGFNGVGLQTKDFDRSLAVLTITKDGRLVTDNRDWWRDDGKPYDLEFDGQFNFYSLEGDPNGGYIWHEYQATFTDGSLVGIEVLTDAQP